MYFSPQTYTIKSDSPTLCQESSEGTWYDAADDTLAATDSINHTYVVNSNDSGRCQSLLKETYQPDDVDEQSVTITSGILTCKSLD